MHAPTMEHGSEVLSTLFFGFYTNYSYLAELYTFPVHLCITVLLLWQK